MTYIDDYRNWSVSRDNSEGPDRNDYDRYGYRKGTVTYDGNLILDNYLISTYGYEYAKQHPLKRI